MLVEQKSDVLWPEQATLRRNPRKQRIIGQLSEITAKPLVDRKTEALFRSVQNFSRQIRRHRRFEQRLGDTARHSDLLRYPRGPFHEDMIEERRAGFEPVGHTGDIDLYHQIVGKISMQVGPVRALDETVGLGKIGFEKIQR